MSGPHSPAAAAWVTCGAAALTGTPDGSGLVPPDPVLARIRRLGTAAGVDPWAALTERAAIADLRRRGHVSCGGGTRLLAAADGWLAASLVRPDDVSAVAAWLELDGDPGPDPWPAVTAAVARRPVRAVVERAVLLGLPVAAVGEAATDRSGPEGGAPGPEGGAPGPEGGAPGPEGGAVAGDVLPPVRWTALAEPDDGNAAAGPAPLVVDLSSLWAGPLCARTLGDAGAIVVKVEATTRPDGARRGPPTFYDRMHAGHLAVALDLSTVEGRADLRVLVAAADVVIEASRPRALAQLGIDPADLGPTGPCAWVSITGHGRTGAAAHRVGFGDDAAVAGGLVAPTGDGPVFVADAVADPLAGMAAAAAANRALDAGGRWLIDVPLARVAAWVAGGAARGEGDGDGGDGDGDGHGHELGGGDVGGDVEAGLGRWAEVTDPPPPRPRPTPDRPAAPLGAHTSTVLRTLRGGHPLAR